MPRGSCHPPGRHAQEMSKSIEPTPAAVRDAIRQSALDQSRLVQLVRSSPDLSALGPNARLDVRRSDLFELDPEELGEFDVVAMLGILYHLENPVGAMRLARSLTRGVCVIESQVISSDEPIEVRYADGSVLSEPAGFAVHRESDAETALSPLAAMPGVISLIPNRAAIVALALAAGFRSAEVLPEPLDDRGEPRRGDRAVVIARS